MHWLQLKFRFIVQESTIFSVRAQQESKNTMFSCKSNTLEVLSEVLKLIQGIFWKNQLFYLNITKKLLNETSVSKFATICECEFMDSMLWCYVRYILQMVQFKPSKIEEFIENLKIIKLFYLNWYRFKRSVQ